MAASGSKLPFIHRLGMCKKERDEKPFPFTERNKISDVYKKCVTWSARCTTEFANHGPHLLFRSRFYCHPKELFSGKDAPNIRNAHPIN